jgi:SAM-dependent methyltransferase
MQDAGQPTFTGLRSEREPDLLSQRPWRADDRGQEGYDLVCLFDALHDMGDPVGAARRIRKALAPDGTLLLVEPKAGDALEDNLNPVGRTYYGSPEKPFAEATSNRARWFTPACVAASRATSIDGSWRSKPTKVERVNACAMMTVDAPSPHPTSATLAPDLSFSTTPSRAGSHASTRWAA